MGKSGWGNGVLKQRADQVDYVGRKEKARKWELSTDNHEGV